MCKLCEIEHSSRWTCAQAAANQADWLPKKQVLPEVCLEVGEALSDEWEPPIVPRETFNRSEMMKEWWRKKRA